MFALFSSAHSQLAEAYWFRRSVLSDYICATHTFDCQPTAVKPSCNVFVAVIDVLVGAAYSLYNFICSSIYFVCAMSLLNPVNLLIVLAAVGICLISKYQLGRQSFMGLSCLFAVGTTMGTLLLLTGAVILVVNAGSAVLQKEENAVAVIATVLPATAGPIFYARALRKVTDFVTDHALLLIPVVGHAAKAIIRR
jgi:hypothetical protein